MQFKLRGFLLCVLLCFVTVAAARPAAERHEVQRHGYLFEKWVRDTFFDGYTAKSYTQEWDVAREANAHYGHIPVSIKTAKYGAPVDLGDALRQYSVDEEFLLIIGYWKQDGEKKRFVNIVATRVRPETWRALWSPLSFEDVQKLDEVVKDRSLSPAAARIAAQQLKHAAPYARAQITLNPKIGSKNQRRLQCSLSFGRVFKTLAPQANKQPQAQPQLFGVPAPAFYSPPRS